MSSEVAAVHSAGAGGIRTPAWYRASETLLQVAAAIGGIAAIVLGLNIAADVVLRYLFNTGIPGTFDMVSFWWVPLIAVMAWGLTTLRNEHIHVSLLLDQAGPRTQQIVEIVTNAVLVVVVLWLGLIQFEEFLHSVQLGEAAGSTRWVIVPPIRLCIVIAFVLFALALVLRIYDASRALKAIEEKK